MKCDRDPKSHQDNFIKCQNSADDLCYGLVVFLQPKANACLIIWGLKLYREKVKTNSKTTGQTFLKILISPRQTVRPRQWVAIPWQVLH